MHKFAISLVGLGAGLALAAPVSAQYYPARPVPVMGYDRGYGFGHDNGEEIRELRIRIDAIRHQIQRLDGREIIRGRTADRLMDEANKIDRRLSDRARGRFDPREAGDIQYRVQRLEKQVQWARAGRSDRFGDWR